MTTETAPSTHEKEHGMSDAGYIRIALILAAITALEVSTYYVDFGVLFLPALLIMMVIKIYLLPNAVVVQELLNSMSYIETMVMELLQMYQ